MPFTTIVSAGALHDLIAGGEPVLVLDCEFDLADPAKGRETHEWGHIPGARNRFFGRNLGEDGLFRPADELRREFLELLDGLSPEQAVLQCGSGVSACLNLLAMERAGLPGAKLYPGSWSEWCSDPARPVER